jgi:hypothetical protein
VRDAAVRRAAARHADADHGVELAFDVVDGAKVPRQARERGLELDDGGEHLLVEDLRLELPRRPVLHQQRHRVVRLEFGSQRREGHGDLLDLAEAHPDPRPPEIDHQARLAFADPPGDVVGLDLLGSPPGEPGVVVHHQRVAEGAPERARPLEIRRLERARGTAIERMVQAQPQGLEQPARPADQSRTPPLGRQEAVAGAALHALVLVHLGGAGFQVDGPHRADRHAVAASHTLARIDQHAVMLPIRPGERSGWGGSCAPSLRPSDRAIIG